MYIIAIILSLLISFSATPLEATAKTLPKGVWSFSLSHEGGNVEKVGINPSGDNQNWSNKNLEDVVMNDLPFFGQAVTALNQGGANIDGNVKLANSWDIDVAHFDLAYGVTDKFMVFANSAYNNSVIRFTDDFLRVAAQMEPLIENTPAFGRADFEVPGKTMAARYWDDIFIGFKHVFLPNMAVTGRATFGALKIGRNDKEAQKKDGLFEMPTGRVHDQYELYYNFDFKTATVPTRMMLGYIMKTRGHQNFFDNENLDIDLGNMFLAGLGVDAPITKKLNSSWDLIYIHSNADYIKDTDSGLFVEVPNSAVEQVLGKINFTYSPVIFLQTFINLTYPIYNERQGRIYDIPGRIETGLITEFGVRLFYK